MRQPVGIERLLDAREQHREDPEAVLRRCAIDRQRDLLKLPRAQVVGPDEHGARRRRLQALPELALPVASRGQRPSVQPWMDPRPLQVLGDPLHDRPVTTVMRQEDVELPGAARSAVCLAFPPDRHGATLRLRSARREVSDLPPPLVTTCRHAWSSSADAGGQSFPHDLHVGRAAVASDPLTAVARLRDAGKQRRVRAETSSLEKGLHIVE